MNNSPLLHHFPLSAASRFIRLQLAEYKYNFELIHRIPWQRDEQFLSLNPAGSLPVFEYNDKVIISGSRAISEWVEESRADSRLLSGSSVQRAEIRRLTDWFEDKFYYEVGLPILHERVIKRFEGGIGASSENIRTALANAHVHFGYLNWLTERDSWLVGSEISLADLSAAAHISVLDYFGDIQWDKYAAAASWYMKLKSRPCFRSLLTDQLTGVTPSSHYAELDF
jgi:glutathione S-transferase